MSQPEEVFLDQKGRRICGATTRRGTRCQIKDLKENGRCMYHAGHVPPPGPTNQNWINGRSSKLLEAIPHKLRDGFVASMKDPEIISVRSELGLVDTRIMDLVRDLATEQYSDEWKTDLEKQLAHLRLEIEQEDDLDRDAALEAISNAEDALASRDGDSQAWAAILGAIETRRKLVDTERRLLEAHQASVDVNQMKAILLHILTAVREHVLPLDGGRKAVDGIAVEVRKLLLPKPDRARARYVNEDGEVVTS